jgi:signal transduction histidine kinase
LGDLYVLSAPKGISRIEGDHLVEVNHDLDLLSMVASPSGELWFTGGNGIFRFSSGVFTQNKVGPDNPLDYAWFGKADGMPSTQCSIGAPNVVLAPDGKLWVATVQGLAMLTLSHLSFDTAKPRVFVEDVTVGRTRRPAGPELVLPPGTHHVELRFDSISLASPEKIRFQYRMDNVDPVWLDADNSLAAVYTNIPVGTQAFRIRASNSTGVWDREGMVYQVTQQPYIYQTMWFRALCVAVFLALLWGLHRYGMRQVAHEFDVRLEERLNERTRIAQELHDTLLQSFQGLLLHLYVISNLLPRLADEAKDRLNGIIEQAQQAVNEGRDAVQGLRLSTALNGDLAAALGTLVEGLGVKTNQSYPEFHLEVEGKERELKPLVGDEVYRIVGEALRNAFRHAEARRVEVVICYDEKQLTVHIRDDGKGMTEQVLAEKARPGHWGLQGMRERAGKIGAQLKLWSRQETGTEVELKIPAATAYQSRSTWNWLSFRHSSDDVR